MKPSAKHTLLLTVLGIMLLGLQARLWFGEGSLRHVHSLEMQVDELQAENAVLRERNQLMDAEVRDLKQGLDAIEEIARKDLGMVREGETFFIVTEEPAHAAAP